MLFVCPGELITFYISVLHYQMHLVAWEYVSHIYFIMEDIL